jgi:hypothetical protein
MSDIPMDFSASEPRAKHKEAVMPHTAKLYRMQALKSRDDQARLCRRMTFITACMLVPVVAGRRLMQSANTPGRRSSVSVFMEARAEAGAIVPWIFMG